MAIFLLIGIILSFGGAAILTAVAEDSLPFLFYDEAGNFEFLGTMMLYAAVILLVFVIIATLAAIKKKKVKQVDNTPKLLDKIGKVEDLVKEGNYEVGTVNNTVGKLLSKLTEDKIDPNSELNSILIRIEEQNETVPLLKRLLSDSEEQKGRLIVERAELKEKITELEVENEQLEKNNLSLQRVIDNALEPYRDKPEN